MTKTEHFQLNQWELSDRIMMEDFNADNAKIDAALGALSAERIVFGSYTGDGTSSRTIQLPFAPKLLILFAHLFNSDTIAVYTPTADRYVSNDSCSTAGQYGPRLEGDVLRIQHADWGNQKDREVFYILIR